MKKIITAALVVAMLSAMPLSAFAASPVTAIGETDGKDVTGIYTAGSSNATVYSVDVSWGAMEFTYTDASEGTWNPSTHTFDGATAAAWSWADESNKVTVTNHSNAAVNAGLSFTASTGGVNGGFYTETKGMTAVTDSKLTLATAVGTAAGNAPTASAYLKMTDGTINANGKLGTITVTLAEDLKD